MKIGVVGTRNLNPNKDQFIREILHQFCNGKVEIVSGGCSGVDMLAKKFANDNLYNYTEFLPEDKSNRNDYLKRNIQIIDYSDFVIAFPSKSSRGTRHVISECKKRKKQCYVFEV